MNRFTSIRLILAICTLSAGAARADFQPPPLKSIDPKLPTQQAATDIVKKAAIPYVPFSLVDPSTGKSVLPDEIITLYDGTKAVAKEYYAKLNELEAKLNAWGYSFKNNEDNALLTKILVNYGLISEQGKLSDDLRGVFDPAVMEKLKDPSILENILKDDLQKRAEDYLEQLYRDTLLNDIKELGIPNMKVDPKMIAKANADLKTITTKYVDETWGDEKLSVSGNAKLELSGDTKDFEALGQAAIKGQVFNNPFDIFYAYARGKAKQDEKLSAEFFAWALGKELFNEKVESKDTWLSGGKSNSPSPVKFSLKDLGLDGPLNAPIRQAIPVEYYYGIFSLKGEIGYSGSAGIQSNSNVAPSNISASFGPTETLGSFASISGNVGIGPIKVAEAGITGTLTVIEGSAQFEAGLKLDFQEGEASVVSEARGVMKVSAMKGSLKSYAKVKVPTASLPPWEDKTFDHLIYESNGYSSGEMVLFDYKKVTGRFGFSLSTAANADDTAGINLDEELKNHFITVVNDIQDHAAMVDSKTQDALTRIEASRQVYLKFIDDLGTKQ